MVVGAVAFFLMLGNVVTVVRAPDVFPISVGPGLSHRADSTTFGPPPPSPGCYDP